MKFHSSGWDPKPDLRGEKQTFWPTTPQVQYQVQ